MMSTVSVSIACILGYLVGIIMQSQAFQQLFVLYFVFRFGNSVAPFLLPFTYGSISRFLIISY